MARKRVLTREEISVAVLTLAGKHFKQSERPKPDTELTEATEIDDLTTDIAVAIDFGLQLSKKLKIVVGESERFESNTLGEFVDWAFGKLNPEAPS